MLGQQAVLAVPLLALSLALVVLVSVVHPALARLQPDVALEARAGAVGVALSLCSANGFDGTASVSGRALVLGQQEVVVVQSPVVVPLLAPGLLAQHDERVAREHDEILGGKVGVGVQSPEPVLVSVSVFV